MASLGSLEHQVMECLWAAPEGLTAAALRDQLGQSDLALTTVHTLLTRLGQKGFVSHDDGRPRRFTATASQSEHVASVMQEVFEQADDRDAVLARFVGSVTPDEASLLRRLLRVRREPPAAPAARPDGGPAVGG